MILFGKSKSVARLWMTGGPPRRSQPQMQKAAETGGFSRFASLIRESCSASPAAQSIPSMRGSHSEISGMNVTATRNPSIVSSHGHTAMVSSVMPILAMPDAT